MMKKKYFTIMLSIILVSSVNLYAFVMMDNTEQIQKYVNVEILPAEAAKGAFLTVNNGDAVKYIIQKQLMEYYKSSDDKIKIEITMPYESKYKSSTYFYNEISGNNRLITLRLSRKLSDESKKIAKLITSMTNSIIEYNETGNIEEFKTAAQYFGSIYYLDVFIKELCELDSDEMNEFLNIIKYGLYIPNENYENITQKIIDNISKLKTISIEINELNDSNSNTLSQDQKRKKLDNLTQSINDIFWNTFDIVKSYNKVQTDAVTGK
ncbi:hypothetical protein KA977_00810 [Candidatus Dependentiae bacterium]|nr:hypothetical protein [Candidatus Dependentiae bacterium]